MVNMGMALMLLQWWSRMVVVWVWQGGGVVVWLCLWREDGLWCRCGAGCGVGCSVW